MVQHATAAVSIAGSILLCLVFIGLVYDLIAGYSARRRFAKLLSLKKVSTIEQPMGTVSRYDTRGRDHRPKSITCICRRGSIKTELFRLEDHLLYIPRQDVSGDVPMRRV
jgi:hypothetical protein